MPAERCRVTSPITFAAAAATVLALLFAAPAPAALPSWTTYHRDAARSGIDPDSSSPVAPTPLWPAAPALDGQIYGQPLVYGSRVYVATENDSVYALDVASGAIVWQRSAGIAVPSNKLPCGDIGPTVGITSTPVIDPATKRIFVVADTWDGSTPASIAHRLVGFGLTNGDPVPGLPITVDAPGSIPANQLQRPALALVGSEVVIGYGGNAGDCGDYHGRLVAAAENGSGALLSYAADSGAGDHGGAIWGSGNGPAMDAAGHIFVATGNGFSGMNYDGGESVLKLDAGLRVLDHYAPADWFTLDQTDADIGSSEPLLLPNGLIFQIGKAGVGYLLSAAHLGGTGGPGEPSLFHAGVCGGGYGGGVYAAGVIYVACSDGLRALSLNVSTPSFAPVPGWTVPAAAIGPPILAGGLVWDAGWKSGRLLGLDPATGAIKFDANLGTFMHFSSPSAAGGSLFVGNGNTVTALRIATPLPPSVTTTSLSSSANPSLPGAAITLTATVKPRPDAGTVVFAEAGVPIAGCAAVTLSDSTGAASCRTSIVRVGSHPISASYSGDSYYAASRSAVLHQGVHPPTPTISRARLSQSTFTAAHGTTLTLTLTERARMTLLITQSRSGRRVGTRCDVRATRGRRCTLTVQKAKLTFAGAAGRHSFLLRLRTLAAGRYSLSITASDAFGDRSRPSTLTFTVRR